MTRLFIGVGLGVLNSGGGLVGKCALGSGRKGRWFNPRERFVVYKFDSGTDPYVYM